MKISHFFLELADDIRVIKPHNSILYHFQVFQGNVFILSEIRYSLVQELTRRFQVICSVKR